MQDQFDSDPDEEYYKDDEDHYLRNYNDGKEASETGEDPYYDLPPEIKQNETLIEEPLKLNPQELRGNWRAGYALDFYSVSFGRRTEIGALVERVKYYDDRTQIQPIATIVTKFIGEEFAVDGHSVPPHISAIIPIPPSKTDRPFQPVSEIAEKMGSLLNLPVYKDYLIKIKQTPRLQFLPSVEAKQAAIQGAFDVRSQDLQERCILLFDDVCDSGTTLTEATDVLYRQGCVSHVLVLTLTRTHQDSNDE